MDFFTRVISAIASGSGFAALDWKTVLMLIIACVLLYMGIGKGFEPLLMVPIGFGVLLANLPITGLFNEPVYDAATHSGTVGFMWVLYQGVQYAIYPSIIFMGIGAMTDFGPLLANPTSLLLGAAAQLGIFAAFLMALCVGPITSALHGALPFIPVITFSPADAAAIGVIGGADGPTAILTASKLAVELLPAIAIAAYSYMALIPMIQPPLMKALTTKEARQVKMNQLRTVSKTEKIIFPIAVTIFVVLLIPDTAPLIGMLMLGNLFRESGVTERLSDTAQNALINIVTIPLGLSVGFKASAEQFLKGETLFIIVLGLTAFLLSTAGGLILGNVMYAVTGGKVNPLIGSAGVSAVPMAARVAQNVGQKENPSNFLLMHAMGPNVAGVIGSACAAGFMIKVFGG
ncbi:sodium ion-translocating decarboxylase subunit beta [Pseudoflavonifractor sp. 60]|uniref:sodium ion-translocating decarboxylase subunit beta n=1 Tax=Pseudoflavonifractor sp. 60 TaxID=2304576 RepID=UPI00136A208D|nr:sodium ion-translocating decarboxylase subunit beta [Pseudoflavonifractor sp. 60]MCI8914728.1 sodium ion-translocating decarboxylase subunit beta [Lawsonibacter sp.]NBI69350.1 sodium ion-translocating decarboxylase subunit beta [Pseudoflavonifractor sp. 60]